jgi:pimeloyl-ACP methyl ester carboxylesterase
MAFTMGYARYQNEYGQLVGEPSLVDGGTMENVLLFSRENETSDKTLIRHGILVRYPEAEATCLFAHGFQGDKHIAGVFRSMLPKGKYNVLTFDFRAHGEDTQGQICTFGRDEAYDVLAAAKFLRNHPELKNKPLYLYGFSMGAASSIVAFAMDAIEQRTQVSAGKKPRPLFDAMVLDCPFDSSENIIKKGLESLKFSLLGYNFDVPGRTILEKYAFHPYVQTMLKFILKTVAQMDPKNIPINIMPVSPVKLAQYIDVPCLFIHCINDEKVPVSAIMAIYDNATQAPYKMLWLTNGRGHFDSFFYNPEKYSHIVSQFLKQVMTHTLPKHNAIIRDDPPQNLNNNEVVEVH